MDGGLSTIMTSGPVPPPPLTSFNRWLLRGLEGALILLMGLLVLDVLWQVLSRYALRRPSSWTDELATLLIIWVALVGACVGFVRRGHLGVDVLSNRLPTAWRRRVALGVQGCVAVFAALALGLGGYRLVALAWKTGQVSPALGIPMAYVYLVLPLSGVCLLSFSIDLAWRLAGGGQEGQGEEGKA